MINKKISDEINIIHGLQIMDERTYNILIELGCKNISITYPRQLRFYSNIFQIIYGLLLSQKPGNLWMRIKSLPLFSNLNLWIANYG